MPRLPQPMSSTCSPGATWNRLKSTVSRAVLLSDGARTAAGDGVSVVADGGPRDRGPGEPLLYAGVAEAAPTRSRSSGESCRRRKTAASSSTSPGSTRIAASPTTSGSAPVRLATSGVPEAMCSTAEQREALVQRGHRGDLGTGQQLAQLLVGDTGDETHPVAEGQLPDELVGRAAGRRPADHDDVHVALGGQLGDRAQQRRDALEGESALATATMRPGTRSPRGWKNRSSTPSGRMCTCSGATPKSRTMSCLEEPETVRIGPIRAATRACIRTKPYQRRLPNCSLKPLAAWISMRRSTLIGWWMLVTKGRPRRGMPRLP